MRGGKKKSLGIEDIKKATKGTSFFMFKAQSRVKLQVCHLEIKLPKEGC